MPIVYSVILTSELSMISMDHWGSTCVTKLVKRISAYIQDWLAHGSRYVSSSEIHGIAEMFIRCSFFRVYLISKYCFVMNE